MSINKPLISVVIPAGLSREKELIRCLSSIYKSSYKNYEIIVVNNSTNSDLLVKINKIYPKVKTIELIVNTGIYGFNVGFANAQGDYILGIDDDCGLRKNTLENIVKTFKIKPKNVLVIAGYLYNPIYKFFYESQKSNMTNRFSFADGGSAYKRELFQKVGYFDHDFFCWQHSDDLAIRLLNRGYKINFEKSVVIDHYEQKRGLRPIRAFLDSRNAVWFNLKHFSFFMIPFLIFRNLISISLLPIKQKSLRAFFIGVVGYITGWLTFYKPLKNRHVVSFDLQKKFLRYYLFNTHPQ